MPHHRKHIPTAVIIEDGNSGSDDPQISVSYDTQNGIYPSDTYKDIFEAYRFFNRRLFQNKLPECLVTLQRRRRAAGFFCGERFEHSADARIVLDEIGINPAFLDADPTEALGTLVHEMCHLWQFRFGKGSRGRYHNKQWAAKMNSLGLVPSDTGAPGGKPTGDRVSHYIRAGGPFEAVCRSFLASKSVLLFRDRHLTRPDRKRERRRRQQAASKTKFTCYRCKVNAWSNPHARFRCDICEEVMQREERALEASLSDALNSGTETDDAD